MIKILQAVKTFSKPKTLKLYINSRPIKRYLGIDGWLSMNEAYNLYKCARSLPADSTVVEIGSWLGKSTYCIAKGLRSGHVYAIDPFDAYGEDGSAQVYQEKSANRDLLKVFQQNMTSLGVSEKVTPRKGYSRDFVKDFNNINFLFIDGDHSVEGAKFDFENFGHKVVKGGIIAFHDYDPSRPGFGPTYVVDNHVKKSGEFEMIGVFDTLWVGRKIR